MYLRSLQKKIKLNIKMLNDGFGKIEGKVPASPTG